LIIEVIDMVYIKGYLTKEEQNFPLELMLLQTVMGIKSCKTNGEVKDILLQIYLIGYDRGSKNETNYK